MSQMTRPAIEPPSALHRAERELPFVTFLDGLDFQLLQASVDHGLWVVRTHFKPGVTIPTHRHTGEVFAVTFRGSWRYLEYPAVNTAGSYLFEPAGSQHTLHVPADNTGITDVWFAMRPQASRATSPACGCDVHDLPLDLCAMPARTARDGL
jgi:quercetin dioxygenase-like cupin family protein